MEQPRVVGMDCGRGTVYACLIDAPIPNLKEYARSYKPLILKANRDDLELLASKGDVFAIEPTGADHRIFADFLKRAGKTVLYCKGERIRSHALSKGLTNKKDREDAAAIADYCWRALFTEELPNAFVTISGDDIREAYHTLKSLDRGRSPLTNQLWARLAFEYPEFLYTPSGNRRKFTDRDWLQLEPPKALRWIAGEIDYPTHQQAMEGGVGRGLSERTRGLAKALCELERQKAEVEVNLEQYLSQIDDFYRRAFERWQLSPLFCAAFLCSIYPFEKFLGEDGRPVHEYVPATREDAKNEKSFRDRSLKRFMLQMGMGRVIAESGKSKGDWVMGGSRSTRCALYMFIKSQIQFRMETQSKPRKLKNQSDEEFRRKMKEWKPFKVWVAERAEELHEKKVLPWDNQALLKEAIARNKVSGEIARLQIYYALAPNCQNIKDEQRIMKLASRFTRELYRELLRQYKLR